MELPLQEITFRLTKKEKFDTIATDNTRKRRSSSMGSQKKAAGRWEEQDKRAYEYISE